MIPRSCAASSLTVGAASETGNTVGAFTLHNDDDPMLGDFVVISLGVLSGATYSLAADPNGAMLSSDDLSVLSGTTLSGPVGARLSIIDPNSSDEVLARTSHQDPPQHAPFGPWRTNSRAYGEFRCST